MTDSAQKSPQPALWTRPYFWVIGVLIALGVGVGGIVIINLTLNSPLRAVEDYFAALQDGDGATAMSLSQAQIPEGSDGASTALLDGEGLSSTTQNLNDVSFKVVDEQIPEESKVEGKQVVVEVSFNDDDIDDADESSDQADETVTHSAQFIVDRQPSRWGVFSRWNLHPVRLQQVQLLPQGFPDGSMQDSPAGELNSTPIPMLVAEDTGVGGRALVFPPALLDLTYEGTFMHLAQPVSSVITQTGTDPVNLEFQVDLTDKVTETIAEEVQESLAQCTDQQVLQPAGCPFGYSTANRVNADSIRWSIQEEPEVDFSWSNNTPAIEQIRAEARLEVEEISLRDGSVEEVSYDEPFEMDADIDLTPEYLSVNPVWN